ncbi:hypothetical protein B5M09_013046, partial [Aphanomyces astaci]
MVVQYTKPEFELTCALYDCNCDAAQAVAKYVEEQPSAGDDYELVSCATVKKAILAKFGREAKPTFVSKVKALVIEELQGTVAEGFTKLGSYLEKLCFDNP